jgi:drug/metabolite transporter (DMT)-like permease
MQSTGTGDPRRRLFGSLAVLVAATCFGTLGPISRLAYEGGMEPLGFVAWRSTIGGLVLAAYLAIRVARGGEQWVPFGSLPRRALGSLAAATISGVVINLGMFVAFGRMTVALVLLSFYTYPVMVAMVDAVVRRESLGRPTIGALALAVGGMALVVASGLGTAGPLQVDPLGLALAFLAACSQVVFISVSRTGYGAVPTLQAMTTILLGDAIGFVAVAVALGSAAQLAGPLAHPATWGLLLLAGVPGAGIASALFLTGVRWIGGVRTGILALFEPVVGVGLAAVLLAETIGPLQVLGGALVLAAAVVLQVASPPPGPGLPVLPPPEAVPGTI